jgi:hypothetical protein
LGPFRVQDPIPYDLLIDRVSHWHPFAREWLKTAALDGCYVINHPFHFQSLEKQVGFAAMARLGLDVPNTWVLPPKDQSKLVAGAPERLHEVFSLDEVGKAVEYPLFLKPHNGGGWIGVSRVRNLQELSEAYDASGERVMLAQHDVSSLRFARCMVVGPRVAVLPYDPYAPLHARYRLDETFLTAEEETRLGDLCRWINAFHGFEWNTIEFLLRDGRYHPIDFFNGVPDCSPTSLHDYFLWTVTGLLEWCLFVLLEERSMRLSTRMARWLQVARTEANPKRREKEYNNLAAAYYQSSHYQAFSPRVGALVQQQGQSYAASAAFRKRIRQTVKAVFPEHEQQRFSEYFLERIRPSLRPPGPWYGRGRV